jgi:Ras GTPase-activating-like protein IQGAP2/3
MTYADIKNHAQENLVILEERKLVSKANNYQDMLNAIAKDIRNKHRRRIQRRTELKKLRQTLSGLEAKSVYLDDQKNSYDEYIKTCMSNLSKKGYVNLRSIGTILQI